MRALESPEDPETAAARMSSWLTVLLAIASGVIAANVYYVQPLAGPISQSLGLSPQAAGLIVTMTQLGYGAGLLLVVPLGDLFENRRLVLSMISLAALALIAAAMSTNAASFLASALLIGVGSVAVQVLVPYAAHLSPDALRGRAVGNVMSGLMVGIMLARPAASFITHALSWQAVFEISAALMVGLGIALRLMLPRRRPAAGQGYGALLHSMGRLARDTPVLQRRALYHSCLFAAFSLFWTTVPLLLADRFGLSQNGIAWFALAGVGGAIAAPLAGRAADRGWSDIATRLAMLAVAVSVLLGWFGSSGSAASLITLVVAAIVLDFGVIAHFAVGQRAIFSLGAEIRGRLNGLYMATFFTAGAFGSALGGWTYAHGGWSLSMGAALTMPMVALTLALMERSPPVSAPPRRQS
ncbi:MAG: putative major facilitator superfamily drug efflux transporter [Tardiphaga sp.]|uniref:MFS transporter n=1 Tax=Tardiphaga sp. TaxID=1926292 RepID=UPI00261591D2|nr:MFS transporter [Tardiphaga sp.]MDB5502561.1 putative major facilitator superfamily drug efflux transporter [Tardiphaga sp.]